MPRLARPLIALAIAALLVALAATFALAETRLLDGKLRSGDAVTVPADEVVADDLYAVGGTVTVSGTVHGDLTTFAGNITVNGTVDGDLTAAGGTVSVTGTVTGDARVAGGTLMIQGVVGEDVVATGGQVTLGGEIKGDLITSAGAVAMGANVAGNVEASAGTYSKTGSVGGAEHVTIANRGTPQAPSPGTQLLDAIGHFAALLILGALAVWLIPRALEASDATLRREPFLSLGGGLAAILGFAVWAIVLLLAGILLVIAFGLLKLAGLAALSIITALLALFVSIFGFIVLVAYAADLVVGLSLARMAMRDPTTSRWQLFALVAAGALVVVIATSIPVIGGFVKLAVIIFGLGAITVAAWRRWRGHGRDVPPEVQQTPIMASPPPSA